MALPKIATPTYSLTIPSTKKEIKYRPVLVKEEKLLLIAQESSDTTEILNAMVQIIESCVIDNINANDLAIYDLEYIFLKLRSKSVGETSTIQLECEQCEGLNTVTINLDEVEVNKPNLESNIKLNDEISIKLKPIQVKNIDLVTKDDAGDNLYGAIRAVIDSIYTDTEMFNLDDVVESEINEFIDSLTHDNLQQINNWVENQPAVQTKVNFKCIHCGEENEVIIRGFQAFFN